MSRTTSVPKSRALQIFSAPPFSPTPLSEIITNSRSSVAYRAAKASDAARAIAQAATQVAERVRRRGRANAKSEFFYQLALQCERIAVDAASAAARAYKITLTR